MPVSREDGLDVSTVKKETLKGDLSPGLVAQIISRNSDTGGGHMVVHVPAGWSNPKGYASAAQDIYVLEGEMTCGGEHMVAGCYSFIPDGVAYGPISSPKGCRMIVFYGAPFEFKRSDANKPGAKVERLRLNEKTWKTDWEDPMKKMVEKTTWINPVTGQPGRPAGCFVKVLRWDKDPEEQIALVSQAGGFIDPGTEVHPHNECLYLIQGDCYIGYTYDTKAKDQKKVDITLTKDHYLSRPPGIYHGPVTTKGGVFWITYMSDGYHGIFNDVAEWPSMVERYYGGQAKYHETRV
ncbi:MAG: DUF4437 domain-containing protein [Alphaproteobacteria bacterium]|nr:DUF4437 domain-containing protein [Alphaproteobacteria bacterium]